MNTTAELYSDPESMPKYKRKYNGFDEEEGESDGEER